MSRNAFNNCIFGVLHWNQKSYINVTIFMIFFTWYLFIYVAVLIAFSVFLLWILVCPCAS